MSSPLSEFRETPRPRRRQTTEKHGFTMRPLKFLAREIAVKKVAPFSTAVVTRYLVNDFKFAFNRRWNVTGIIVGGPGEGKSRAAFSLARLWTGLTGGEFQYCWDIDQIPDVNDGDWLHIDEWFIPEGPGKLIALQRLKHLFDTCRAKMICISISTPETPESKFCTFELAALAQNFNDRRNLFEVRVPLPRRKKLVYIGNVLLPLGRDTERWLEYENEAYERKDAIWRNKGKKTVKFNVEIEDAAEEVLKWVKEQGFVITSKSQAMTFVKAVGREKKWDINYSNLPDIADWMLAIKRRETKEETEEKKTFGDFSDDWKGLREFVEQWCLGQDPPRREYATATALWIVPDSPPLSQDDVFDLIDFGDNPVKAATLAREIRKLRRRIQRPDRAFTDFTEEWVASQLVTLGARKVGGQDQPDILLEAGEGKKEVAVKFCVRNDPFYDYTVAPERDGVVVIVIPRQLQFFVTPIQGSVENEHLQLDNARVREKGTMVGLEDLADTVREMLDGVE